MGRYLIRSLTVLTAVGLLGWLQTASAQDTETKKFNSKALEKTFQVPVYAPKKVVVLDNQYIENTDDEKHSHNVVYSVRDDIKKPVEFYTKEMGTPEEKDGDTGSKKFIFRKTDPNDPRIRRKVILQQDPDTKGLVQINLYYRQYATPDDANAD